MEGAGAMALAVGAVGEAGTEVVVVVVAAACRLVQGAKCRLGHPHIPLDAICATAPGCLARVSPWRWSSEEE